MGFALKVELQMENTSCCVCATRFSVDRDIMNERRKNAGSIWCPNGHRIGWGETEADGLRKQLEAKNKELESEQQRVRLERQSRIDAEAQLESARLAIKRQTKRINAGVCPHCNRTFKQLAAHMKCKHGATTA